MLCRYQPQGEGPCPAGLAITAMSQNATDATDQQTATVEHCTPPFEACCYAIPLGCPGTVRSASYAVSGTDVAYGATSLASTDMAYGATSAARTGDRHC
eukprot:1558664-Rhodomonas_salina.7